MKLAALALLTVGACGALDVDIDQSRVIPPPEGFAEADALLMRMIGPGPAYPVVWYSFDAGLLPDGADGLTVEHSPLSHGVTILVYQPGQKMHDTALAHERLHWRSSATDHPASLFGDYNATLKDGGYAKRLEDTLDAAGL